MEPRGRVPVLAGALGLGAAVAGFLAAAPGARAAVYLTQPQALAEAFPGARIERRPLFLTTTQARAVERRARVKLASRLITPYLAWRGDTLQGTAFFDTRIVRTMPAVLMVVVGPDTTIARVEVLAFHEPTDYLPSRRWLGLFSRRRLDDRLWPGRAIRSLSGATLTTRSITDSARLSLALYELAVAPLLARR